VCFERDAQAGRKVPGCQGKAYEDNNYCIKMPSKVPSVSPSMDPSLAPSVTPSSTPSYNPSSEPTCYGGKGDGTLENIEDTNCPLKECTGDCDEDTDCSPGLKCFQRSGDKPETIPGCRGDPDLEIDYCYKV